MRNLKRLGTIAVLAVGLLVGGAPRLAAAAPAANPAPPGLVKPPSAEQLPEDANRRQLRYAEREAASPRSAEFKGGHGGVYIGGSAVVVVLLIVLIVVLI